MKSIDTSLIILGNLIIFTVITNLIKHYINISPLVLSILSGILELTNGVVSVSSLDITLYLRIVFTSFLNNFTSLSIRFQSMSILGKYKLNIKRILIIKLVFSIISTFIALLLVPTCC